MTIIHCMLNLLAEFMIIVTLSRSPAIAAQLEKKHLQQNLNFRETQPKAFAEANCIVQAVFT